MEDSISRLKEHTHSPAAAARMQNSRAIFPGSTLRISPMSRLLNLVKLPPSRVAMKMPRATAVEENTPITGSLAISARRRT